ncbi:class I SAM-dependent methyltransferase [Novispirillum sp. DQ9]|uniref:class I SAM-dependent methyltransferase n=1 Tax=Novispirillum sp. DQ9 TaxID=3398612 RepID=UPI003C7D1E01
MDETADRKPKRPDNPSLQALLAACPTFDSIKGWLPLAEAGYLYQLASATENGVIVEIGSAFGRSTTALSLGSRAGKGAAVFAVDPHETFTGVLGGQFGPENRRAFYQNMLAHGGWENVRLINLPSAVVGQGWQRPIALLWIDGDHAYEAVALDLKTWEPHLVPGAKVVFDDAQNPNSGPARVVQEALASGKYETGPAVGKTRTLIYRGTPSA